MRGLLPDTWSKPLNSKPAHDDLDRAEVDRIRVEVHFHGLVEGWTLADPNRIDMMDVLRNAKPNVRIGVTARPGLFDDAVLGQMAANDPRPVIMALSNPTSKVECTPEAVSKATNGCFLWRRAARSPRVSDAIERIVRHAQWDPRFYPDRKPFCADR